MLGLCTILFCFFAVWTGQIYCASESQAYEYDCYSAEDDQKVEKTPSLTSKLSNDVCLTPDCVVAAGTILSTMNPAADPCEDFYDFSCGGFELHHSIPAGESRFRQFNVVDRIIQRNLRKLLEQPTWPTSEASARFKARRYYTSCMDVEKIAKNSLPWFRTVVAKMGGFRLLSGDQQVPPNWNLNFVLKRRSKLSLNGPFTTDVGPDDKNVLTNIVKMSQGGLGLGDNSRDYYLDKEITTDPILTAYIDWLKTYAELALGTGKVDRQLVFEIVEFEQKLAKIQRPQSEQENTAQIYFKTDINWLQKNADFIDWRRYFNDLFKLANITMRPDEPVLLYNAPYFKDLNILMKQYLTSEKGKRALQNYFIFRAVMPYLPLLSEEFQAPRDKFLAIFQGQKGSLDRWQTCISDTDSNVGFGLGAMYVDKYFPPEYKFQIERVVADLVNSFRTRIQQVPWMDDSTRASAIDKVNALAYDVSYPRWLQNETYLDIYYEGLRVTDDYVVNQVLSYIDATRRILSFLRRRPDPLRWAMSPQTVNAYYEQTQNKIFIPAGILNPPYFFPTKGVPMALNYGAIGSVAGHEISHGFDNAGRDYDKLGNLFNWWSNVTRQQFDEGARCFVEKFDAYEYDSVKARGDQTLNENIADDAGVKASYQAFVKARTEGRNGLPNRLVGVNLTDDQLFFIAWAQQWCSIYTDKMIRFSIFEDSHSLFLFRVTGPLSNSPNFANVFNCPPGSKMNPVKKCSVW